MTRPATPRRRLGSASLIAAIAAAQPAFAQTAETSAPVDEIIVTGQYLYTDSVNALRSPTPIIDVPQSLSIVTADEIALRGFTQIGQIIDYTPGVVNSQGEGHRDAVVFRGVRSTADFFIDGMRDDVQYYRPLYNLEQVEILRGPNALLFGRGGTGGILNRVTKKGQLGESFTGYQFGIDTLGAAAGSVDLNFATTENSAVRINALYEQLNNHRNFFDGERIGFNPAARVALTSDTTLDLSYEYADHAQFIDRGIPTGADGRPVEAFEDIVFGDPEINETTLQAHLLRASVQHRFSDTMKANVSAFYGDYDKFYGNLYAASYDAANTPDRVTLDGYEDTTERQNLILSGTLINEFDTGFLHHIVVAGVEYIDTNSDQNRFNTFFDASQDDRESFTVLPVLGVSNGVGVNADGVATTNDFSVDLNDDTRVDIGVFSAFLQNEIAISEHLDVILGARFDSFDIEVFNVPASETRTRRDEEISPRFGLVYKPRENISLYGSYSESFQPRSGEQFANINGNNDRLDPNTFTNLEAGLKWDVSRGLSLTAAVFEIEQESPVVSDTDASTFDIIRSNISGFEAQLKGQLTDDWFLSAGYSYLDGKQAGSELRPRELPRHTLSLWNAYQVAEQFGLGLGLTYQDDSFVNNSNSAVLPSYTRVDAAAWYDVTDTMRLQLNVENLTDELYFPTAHATHQVSVGRPLNARLSVSNRF